MIRQVGPRQSQKTVGNVMITFPEHHTRQSKPVSVQRINAIPKGPIRYYDEYIVVDREKEATTGRWVLNVIAAHEAYHKSLKTNKNDQHSRNKKKHSFASRKSIRVEPVEYSSSQFMQTQIHQTQIKNNKNQNINQLPHQTMLSPTTIGDGQTTPLSSFSTATSIGRIQTPGRSITSSQTKSNSRFEDCSTDEFENSDEQGCISKRMIITCTILSILLIIGIIIAVFVTIFVGKNQSTNSTAKLLDLKSLLVSLTTINGLICPTIMFNITDPLCQGEIPYNYYSCYQIATSTSFTIQFALQHDTMSGHWYFDDISATQNDNTQLIINGGFESNLTGWILNTSSNSTPEIYVDTMAGLAHTGLAYLYGVSKNYPVYIQQTFNVIEGEYINVSFWWGYDGGFKLGNTCQAIGQLVPSL